MCAQINLAARSKHLIRFSSELLSPVDAVLTELPKRHNRRLPANMGLFIDPDCAHFFLALDLNQSSGPNF